MQEPINLREKLTQHEKDIIDYAKIASVVRILENQAAADARSFGA